MPGNSDKITLAGDTKSDTKSDTRGISLVIFDHWIYLLDTFC